MSTPSDKAVEIYYPVTFSSRNDIKDLLSFKLKARPGWFFAIVCFIGLHSIHDIQSVSLQLVTVNDMRSIINSSIFH